jgi:hypothetical protein
MISSLAVAKAQRESIFTDNLFFIHKTPRMAHASMTRTSEIAMSTFTTWLHARTPPLMFPGRLRIFCDERCRSLLSLDERELSEWQGARGNFIVAAAIGAAYAEIERGGWVVVLVPRTALEDMREVLLIAPRMGLLPLTLVIIDDTTSAPKEKDSHWLDKSGWKTNGHVLAYEFVHFAVHHPSYPPPKLHGDWPPVRMATTIPGSLPPWPVDETSVPLSSLNDWFAWLRGREPQLMLVDMTPPLIGLPAQPWLAAILAQLACEGRRVCWRLPKGVDMREWLAVLHDIGRRGMALKLFMAADDLLTRPILAPLTGWWILVPNDVEEAAAMFAYALEHEDPIIIALPSTVPPQLPAWPTQHAYIPGSGRWMRHGKRGTIICDFRTVALAEQAAEQLTTKNLALGVLICSSILPLPIGDIDHLPGTALFVCGNDLGVAWTSAVLDQERPVTIIPDQATLESMVNIITRKISN